MRHLHLRLWTLTMRRSLRSMAFAMFAACLCYLTAGVCDCFCGGSA
jgi:hypothetical protein